MALSSEDITELVSSLVHGSEERFIAELTQTIVDEFAAGLNYSAEVDLLTLSRAFPTKASVIVLKYRDQIRQEVREEIQAVLDGAVVDDLKALEKFYGTIPAAEGASVHFQQVSRQTAVGVSQIIERQNVALAQSLQDTWYKVSAEAVTAINEGLKPRQKVLADGVVKLMNAGINVVPYHKDGKPTVTNHVDVALRRHITTQVSQAGGRMSLEAMDLYNHDLVITDAHYGARPTHSVWQGLPCCRSGSKTIDGVTYPDMVSLTEYGSVTGLKGANCRHMIFPYFPGISKLPDREFLAHKEKFGMSSDKYYEATQKQRELERRVRKTKREIAGLEQAGLGFENPTYVNKRLTLGGQQKQLKKLCDEKGLARLYEREKAYGVAVQPRALRVDNRTTLIEFLNKPSINAQLKMAGITKTKLRSELREELRSRGASAAEFANLTTREQRETFDGILSRIKLEAKATHAKPKFSMEDYLYELDGEKKPMSFKQADGGKVNPNYLKKKGSDRNCQTCCAAYVARRNGFNVVAKLRRNNKTMDALARKPWMIWRDENTFSEIKPAVHVPFSGRDSAMFIENMVKQGEIHTLAYKYRRLDGSEGGHTVIAERNKRGELFIYDPQTSKIYKGSDISQYLTRASELNLFRCDNAILKVDIAKEVFQFGF